MEFKLNHIDTNVRRKLQEEIKEDKVHSSKNLDKKSTTVNDKKKRHNNQKNPQSQMAKRRYITIDGIKSTQGPIEIKAEKMDVLNEDSRKGMFLDTKK